MIKIASCHIPQIICVVFLGIGLFVGFLLMYGWAVWKGDFIFHGGRIRGKIARAIGIFGLIGLAAGTYLVVSLYVFNITPPFAPAAAILAGLMMVMAAVIRISAIFIWHEK